MKNLFIAILAMLFINGFSQVVPNVDWVKNYGSRYNIDNGPTAIDADNNVYVSGWEFNGTDKDLVVLKYDSLGTLVWSYSYNNGADDVGSDIKIDAAKNVYVTGTSYDVSSGNDYLTIMLDPTGNLVWTNRYNGYGNGDDEGKKILLDNNNLVYVVGDAFNGNDKDITTISIDLSGNLNWENYFDNGFALNDSAVAIVTDQTNFYITGHSDDGVGSTDIVTLMLDNGGNLNWFVAYNGSFNSYDFSNGIVLAGGNVVVCGSSNNTTTGDDYVTLKYDCSSGSLVWQADYDGGYSGGIDAATSLVRDSIGNIAVTGLVYNGGPGVYEYHTVLYDSTGIQLWVNKENMNLLQPLVEPKIAVDTIAHHFYVSGEYYKPASGEGDVIVYQIEPGGSSTWKKKYAGLGGGNDASVGFAVNGTGVVFLSTLCQNGVANYDITTIKISQTPIYFPIDFNNINEPGSPSHYFYPNSGEILYADTTLTKAQEVLYYTKQTNPQEFLLNNNKLAFVLTKSDSSGNDTLHRVDLEFFHGNPLTEPFNFERHDTDGVLNYFLAHLGSNITDVKGNSRIMIPNIYPGIDVHFYSNDKGLKMYFVVKPGSNPSSINLLFNGASSTTITGSNQLKVNTSVGNFQFENAEAYWVDPMLNTYSVSTSWNSLGGNIYGVNTGTYNTAWPLIVKIGQGAASTASIQNIDWSTYFGGANTDYILKSKSDASNNLFISGSTISSSFPQAFGATPYQSVLKGGYDGFLAKFSAIGELKWSTYLGGAGSDQITDFDFKSGSVYCIGSTTSLTLSTQSKSGAYNDNSFAGGYNDGFIFQTSQSSGNSNNWLTFYGEAGEDNLKACKFDGSGNFFVVGSSSSTNIAVVGSAGQYQQTYNTAQLSQPNGPNVLDGIIMKFNASNSALNWATYYGTYLLSGVGASNSDDDLKCIDISSTDIFVGGYSLGVSLPSSINSKGTANFSDGIIANFSTNGALVASKYTTNLENNSLKVYNSKVYACGQGKNGMTPVNSGSYYYDGTCAANDYDADFSVHSLNLTTTLHASFLGGFSEDRALDLQFGPNGVFYIAGATASAAFTTVPVTNAYQGLYNGGDDYFLSAFKEGISTLVWSTCLGSPSNETNQKIEAASIAIDGNNNLHLCGATDSYNTFPIDNGGGLPVYFQGTRAGSSAISGVDATITRFNLVPINTYVGIKEITKTSSSLSLYPNPTSKHLLFSGSDISNNPMTYCIYNLAGQKVMTGQLDTNSKKQIDVSGLQEGLYVITGYLDESAFSFKFIKIQN